MVGAAEWQLVADGGMAYERELIFPHVAPAELERLGISGDVVTPYNALLIRLGGRVILVDAGLGGLAAAFGAPAGRLRNALADAGVRPDEVDVILVTHGHADHVGGLTESGTAVFPRARHYLARAE